MAEVKNPVKLDDTTVKKIEEASALDCSIKETCLYANITRQTYYNWINSFPELKERFDILRSTPFLKARRTIVESLKEPQHAFEYMKRKRKKEFSERTEMTGADGEGLKINIINYGDNSSL
jgi:hypothetical protein